MIYKKGETIKLPLVARNLNNGIVDVTSATITFNFKADPTQTTNLFQKLSTTEGQIDKVTGVNGFFVVNIDASDTSGLVDRDFYYECIIVVSSVYYKLISFMKFEPTGVGSSEYRQQGTTAQRPDLPSGSFIGFQYYDTDNEAAYWWSGTEWT